MKGFVSLIWKMFVFRGNKSIPTTAPEARKTRWQPREAGKGVFEVILVLRCQEWSYFRRETQSSISLLRTKPVC